MKAKNYRPFIIKKSLDNQFYFVIVARNKRVLMTSETYTRRSNVKKAIVGVASLSHKIFELYPGNLYIDETKQIL